MIVLNENTKEKIDHLVQNEGQLFWNPEWGLGVKIRGMNVPVGIRINLNDDGYFPINIYISIISDVLYEIAESAFNNNTLSGLFKDNAENLFDWLWNHEEDYGDLSVDVAKILLDFNPSLFTITSDDIPTGEPS